jgi:nucleoside-diphosphate-sugar epimerase
MGKPISVLVTGSAGRIGSSACLELKSRGHRVRGLDARKTTVVADSVTGDMSDLAAVRKAMEGIEAVVHLGAIPHDTDFMTGLLPSNIVGVYNVLEAAREAGAWRVILASTGQVVEGHQGPWPIKPEMPISPRNWYAAAKVFAEAAGQIYAYSHGMSVIVARLGWCPRAKEDLDALAADASGQDVYFSPPDAGRFFACAVEAPPDIRYCLLYAMSKPVKSPRFDVSDARRLLGYEPQDRWPQGSEVVLASPVG